MKSRPMIISGAIVLVLALLLAAVLNWKPARSRRGSAPKSGGAAPGAAAPIPDGFIRVAPQAAKAPASAPSARGAADADEHVDRPGDGFDPNHSGPRVADVKTSATAVRFTLNLPFEADKTPRLEQPPVLVVPANQPIAARLVSAVAIFAKHGSPESASPANTADASSSPSSPPTRLRVSAPAKDAAEFKQAGVMRRWTVGSVAVKPALFTGAGVPPGAAGTWELEFEVSWPTPVDPARPAPVPAEADPKSPWGSVAAATVANPGDLARFQMADPPLATGIKPVATAPWRLAPGKRRWARVRVAREGLTRLDLDDLIGAGFDPATLKPADARVFSRGEPTPLVRVGQGAAQLIYFWSAAPDSVYSPDRVFWVAMAPDLPDSPLAEFAPPAGEGGAGSDPLAAAEIVAQTRRVATRANETRLKIETGNFLSIKMMDWVDSPLRPGSPLAVPLKLAGLAPAGPVPAPASTDPSPGLAPAPPDASDPNGDIRAEIRLYTEGAPLATGARVNLRLGDQILGSAVMRSAADRTHNFTVPRAAVPGPDSPFQLDVEQLEGGVALDDRGTTVWLASLSLNYPSLPELIDGHLDLQSPDSPTSRSLAWTPLTGPQAAFKAALAVAINPAGRATGALRPRALANEFGYLWPLEKGSRVAVASPDAIPATRSAERVEIDDLADPDQGADYVIIAHRQFMKAVEPLVQMHEKAGLKVRLIDVQSVYDNFSNGELTPAAIRDFFAHALTKWTKGAPSNALLVGDTTSDYLDHTKSGLKNWVPTYTYDNGYDDFASDHWMTPLAGDDDLSDIMLGRISVNSLADCEAVVAKTVKYASERTLGPWRARATFVADDGGFAEPADEIRRRWNPLGLDAEALYMNDRVLLEDNWYLPQQFVTERRLKVSPQLTSELTEAFERGSGLVLYYGHGSPNIWMDERVWFGGDSINSDNQHLAGTGRLSFIATMSCNTGAIDYPVPKGLPGVSGGGWNINISEDMMRVPDGGAIAMFVPSGPEGTSTQQNMARELWSGMTHHGLRRFGEATTFAKNRYTLNGGPKNLLYMFILLGDPVVEDALAPAPVRLAGAPAIAAPGEPLRLAVAAEGMASGKFVARLRETAEGRELWSAPETEFTNGMILLNAPIPADAPAGDARLSLYAWDQASGKELAAGADIRLQRAEFAIADAGVATSAGKTTFNVALNYRTATKTTARIEVFPVNAGEAAEKSIAAAEFAAEPDAGADTTTGAGTTGKTGAEFRKANLAIDAPEAIRPVDQPAVFEVRLTAPDAAPAGRPDGADRRRVVIAPSPAWTGLVPDMSTLRQTDHGLTLNVDAAGIVGRSDRDTTWRLGLAGSGGISVSSVLEPDANGVARARLTLRLNQGDELSTTTLWMAPDDGKPTTKADEAKGADPRATSWPVKDLKRREPRLRIVPESARLEPASPFEGQTILARFEVENAGDAASEPFTVSLMERPPNEGGQPIEDHINGMARKVITELAAGGRADVLLRADPISNAGERTLHLWVDPYQDAAPDSGSEPDRLHKIDVKVKTKASLRKGPTTIGAAPGSVKEHPLFLLRGPVSNEGETDATNVLVTFYRSEIKTPENELGRQLLPVIPGGESRVAEVVWEPSREELLRGLKTPEPQHQLRLNWRREFKPRESAAKPGEAAKPTEPAAKPSK